MRGLYTHTSFIYITDFWCFSKDVRHNCWHFREGEGALVEAWIGAAELSTGGRGREEMAADKQPQYIKPMVIQKGDSAICFNLYFNCTYLLITNCNFSPPKTGLLSFNIKSGISYPLHMFHIIWCVCFFLINKNCLTHLDHVLNHVVTQLLLCQQLFCVCSRWDAIQKRTSNK